MGNELDNPILTKNSIDKETLYIKLGSSCIQGWKTRMEEYNFFLTDNYRYNIFSTIVLSNLFHKEYL